MKILYLIKLIPRRRNDKMPECVTTLRNVQASRKPAEGRRGRSASASEGSEPVSRARRRLEREGGPALLCARRVWRALDARRSQTAAAYRSCRRCHLRDTTCRPLLRGVHAHVLTLEFRASRISQSKGGGFYPRLTVASPKACAFGVHVLRMGIINRAIV